MTPIKYWLRFPTLKDPRIPVAGILFSYIVLGMAVLGFNRSPLQMITTVATAVALDMLFHRLLVDDDAPLFPLSAMITGMSLSILIDYSHGYLLATIPPLFAIASKYLVTYRGRHVYNPTLFGAVASLLLMDGMISASPSYLWDGRLYAIAAFVITMVLFFFTLRIKRIVLILSFLVFYGISLLIRAWLTHGQVSMTTWMTGALTAPAFYLFTFFIITDSRTSPDTRSGQVLLALGIVLIDAGLRLKQGFFTFFFAAFLCATLQLAWLHGRALIEGLEAFAIRARFGLQRWATLGLGGCLLWLAVQMFASVNQGAEPDATQIAAKQQGIVGAAPDGFARTKISE